MICVTGAGGTVGGELVRQLETAAVPFRAAYFSIGKVESARARGLDAVLIDYGNPETVRAAFEGCDKLFLLGPSAPDQVELEINAVEAAQAGGVKHIVKLSVMYADKEEYEIGRIHREVEKAIEASGLDWTFLRANSFMQNTVTFMSDSIRGQSAFYSSAEDGKISNVDVRDIAAVAVKALTELGHEKTAYTLNGPEAFSYDEMAARLSDVLGRTISHVNLPPADLKGAMLGMGMPEILADHLLDLDRYFREGKAAADSSDISTVLGRDARRFADYARETAGTGVWDVGSKTEREVGVDAH